MKVLRSLLVGLFVLVAVTVEAQVQAPVSGTFTTYLVSAPTVPVGTPAVIPVGAGGFVCNQVPVTGVVVNPNKIEVDDPVNVGQACIYTDTGTGPIASLPFTFGTVQYQGTVKWTYGGSTGGTTGESLPSLPFTKPAPVPTGVKVLR